MKIRQILEDARVFARSEDWTGGIARAQLALSTAQSDDERNACQLEIERLEEGERAWRAEIESRRASYLKRELTTDGGPERTGAGIPRSNARPPARERALFSFSHRARVATRNGDVATRNGNVMAET
ncbi:hypothetical protein [Pendulispora albinea]|uniref:Uncharacterized protein n=1 Tax=Pendulispora albinea TaxID=2741071 RepID=A0ABZ2M1Z3_9BACT